MVWLAVNTVWSTPERIRGEVSRWCAIQIDVYLYLTKFHRNRKNFLWTDGQTYGWTDIWPILLGRLFGVDLKINKKRRQMIASCSSKAHGFNLFTSTISLVYRPITGTISVWRASLWQSTEHLWTWCWLAAADKLVSNTATDCLGGWIWLIWNLIGLSLCTVKAVRMTCVPPASNIPQRQWPAVRSSVDIQGTSFSGNHHARFNWTFCLDVQILAILNTWCYLSCQLPQTMPYCSSGCKYHTVFGLVLSPGLHINHT